MRAELLAEIGRYVAGESGVNDLQGWLVAHLQAIVESSDQVAIKVANQLDVDLIHLTDGVVSEQSVWEHLVEVIREHDPFLLSSQSVEVISVHGPSFSLSSHLVERPPIAGSGPVAGWEAETCDQPFSDVRLTGAPR